MAKIERETLLLVTFDPAKVERLQAGAKWRYKGLPYRTTGIVSLAGTPPRWELRGVADHALRNPAVPEQA